MRDVGGMTLLSDFGTLPWLPSGPLAAGWTSRKPLLANSAQPALLRFVSRPTLHVTEHKVIVCPSTRGDDMPSGAPAFFDVCLRRGVYIRGRSSAVSTLTPHGKARSPAT